MLTIKTFFIITIIMLILDGIYLTIFSKFFNDVVMRVQGSKLKINLLTKTMKA